jgi:hypothetical protein
MKIYEAKLGGIGTIGEDRWLVRAENFSAASKKAVATAAKKAQDFTHAVDIISLSLIGKEE